MFNICSNVTNSPKKEHKGKGKDSFQDFEENTIDAWDDGDDDLLVMNPQVVQSTALQVHVIYVPYCFINRHTLYMCLHYVIKICSGLNQILKKYM